MEEYEAIPGKELTKLSPWSWESCKKKTLDAYHPRGVAISVPRLQKLFQYSFSGGADEAFALHRNLIKPYAKKDLDEEKHVVFNKILSSARSVVENAFGILTARFRVLLSTMYLDPKKASIVTLACCYLHNFLIEENGRNYLPGNGETLDSSTLVQLQRTKHKNNPTAAKAVRDSFADYYYSQETVQPYEESEEI
ncbi:hypothetical protein JTB14_015438 [Gonioctena quinquepunctata]|nr:hypothetical protein JTB14_015438 [Gonioctena quinquepunctata]